MGSNEMYLTLEEIAKLLQSDSAIYVCTPPPKKKLINKCVSVSVLCLDQHLVLSAFLILAILTGV